MADVPRTEESIFAEALEQPSAEARTAFLDRACGSEATLRRRVEALLKSHEQADGFLRPPSAATVTQPTPERPGSWIGPYKLLQQLGEGGMGVVFMAEQTEPVRRRVALKVIKPGLDSAQVLARFEAERQALALMDHPNIARVLDAGTTGAGRSYQPGRAAAGRLCTPGRGSGYAPRATRGPAPTRTAIRCAAWLRT